MTAEDVKTKAPQCAAWAEELREVFGEARMLRLEEGGMSRGRPDPHVYATCLYRGSGELIRDE